MKSKPGQSRMFMPATQMNERLGVYPPVRERIPAHLFALVTPRKKYVSRLYHAEYVNYLAESDEWKNREPSAHKQIAAAISFSTTDVAEQIITDAKQEFHEKAHRLAAVSAHAGMLTVKEVAELAEINVSTVNRWHLEGLLDHAGVIEYLQPSQFKYALPVENLDKVLRWQEPESFD